MQLLVLLAAVGCGAAGGVLFGFSAFVMHGLAHLPVPQGIRAMQAINVSAVRPAFMTLLFGTAALCLVLLLAGLLSWDEPASPLLVAGAALYLAGTIGLTGGYHVPRNNALDALDPDDETSAAAWAAYLRDWTRWNHVRTAAALLAAAALTLALTRQ